MAVPSDWYELETVADGITLVRERYVAPWLRCNIWHVRGRERDVLIDTGMGLRPLRAEIPLLTGRPLTAICTHCHFDHMGGAHEFDIRLGHASEAHIHAGPTLNNSAASGWIIAETFLADPHAGFSPASYCVKAAPLTGFLDEGDVVDLGDRCYRILHLPGHSPGSIALYEEDTRILFSGDAIYNGALFDTVYHSDKAIYRDSLRRLRELPVTAVHGGHFSSFGQDRMREIIDAYLDGCNTVGDIGQWIAAQPVEVT